MALPLTCRMLADPQSALKSWGGQRIIAQRRINSGIPLGWKKDSLEYPQRASGRGSL